MVYKILKTDFQIFVNYSQNENITFKKIGRGGGDQLKVCLFVFEIILIFSRRTGDTGRKKKTVICQSICGDLLKDDR